MFSDSRQIEFLGSSVEWLVIVSPWSEAKTTIVFSVSPRPVQRSEQAAELTVDTAHVGEIVTHGGGLGHRRVGVVAHEQFGQRLVLVTFISLQVAVACRSA